MLFTFARFSELKIAELFVISSIKYVHETSNAKILSHTGSFWREKNKTYT